MESHIVKTRSLNTIAAAPRQKTMIALEPRPTPLARDPNTSDARTSPVALARKPDETPREARPNHRRVYISMRIPQARDEIREIVEAMRELRARPKPLIRTAADQDASRQIVYCRERMKEIRGEIQRLTQERAAILSAGT